MNTNVPPRKVNSRGGILSIIQLVISVFFV
nr:MAG TPA: hypothetical protein [Inoviridae sp.]